MAPVLQCPDCGTKHPLANVPDAGTFACTGCGRMLKIPAFAPAAPAARPPVVAGAPTLASTPATSAPERTRAMPVVTRNEEPPGTAAPNGARDADGAPVRWWMQLLLWIVAVPFAFVAVFLGARAVGVFSSDQLSDVFLANGAARFWPVVRLLPVVALLTAGIVQGGVLLLSKRNTRHGGRAR
jgi:hypothetical protein